MYLHVEDLVEVETCRRNISDKLLFITDYVICLIKYCIMKLLHGTWITLNMSRNVHLTLENQRIRFLKPLAHASRKYNLYNEVIKKQLRGNYTDLDIEKYRLQWRNYLEWMENKRVRLHKRPEIKEKISVFWYKTPFRLVSSHSSAKASNTEQTFEN